MRKLNNKGYTFLELVATMVIILPLIFGLLYIPTELYSSHKDYTKIADYNAEHRTLKNAIIQDSAIGIVYVYSNGFKIGDNLYTFKDDGVYRNSMKINNYKKEFKVDNRNVLIYDDISSFEVSIGSNGFKRGGL